MKEKEKGKELAEKIGSLLGAYVLEQITLTTTEWRTLARITRELLAADVLDEQDTFTLKVLLATVRRMRRTSQGVLPRPRRGGKQ